MRNKDVNRLAALRSAKTAIMLEATKDGSSSQVSDEVSLRIISKLVKQRKESVKIYVDQGRQDLADEELNQLVHLDSYLPSQMEEEEILIVVQDVIRDINAVNLSDFGKCMSLLMSKLRGQADGNLISKILKKELSN